MKIKVKKRYGIRPVLYAITKKGSTIPDKIGLNDLEADYEAGEVLTIWIMPIPGIPEHVDRVVTQNVVGGFRKAFIVTLFENLKEYKG